MAVLAAHGVELDLPAGWDGRIRRRETVSVQHPSVGSDGVLPMAPPVVVHAATFSLPVDVGDFGGAAVERMTAADLFVALVEFDAPSAGAALFRRRGLPRAMRPEAFNRQALQRVIPGQGGAQAFFVESGRPFCLYVVLGSHARRARTVPVVNGLLAGVRIS